MSVDLIRYDLLVQDALRGVVRRVLTDVARDGLPGEHHLYISFDTRAAGVRLSPRLKGKYPEEMTIVLQHQFWNLIVTETQFEVSLSFNNQPERLLVPFAALKGFFDPSVKFGLQFEPPEVEEPSAPAPAPVASVVREVRESEPARPPRGAASEPAETPPASARPKSAPPASVPAAGTSGARAKPAPAAETEKPARKEPPAATAGKSGDGGAEVVRLDTFRKK